MNASNHGDRREFNQPVPIRANEMIAALLRVSKLDRLEDIDAYAASLEAIVFELIARQIDGPARGMARAVYRQGMAAGLHGSDVASPHEGPRNTVNDLDRPIRRSTLMDTIRHAGEGHGRAIRLEIARARAVRQ